MKERLINVSFYWAKIYPVVGRILENGMIKVDKLGKIVDLGGKIIIPGLVDAHTHVGMWGDGEGRSGKDGNESVRAITGEVRAIDSVNPRQVSFEGAREGGFTTELMPLGDYGFSKKYGWLNDEYGVSWQLNLPK